MDDRDPTSTDTATSHPAYKGKTIGPRPPLRGHVWSIGAKLHLERRLRDLALFNLAIDGRGCDLIALRASDVAPNGYALDRASVRQKKTGGDWRAVVGQRTAIAIQISGLSKARVDETQECRTDPWQTPHDAIVVR